MKTSDLQISFCQDLVMLLSSGSNLDSALRVVVESRSATKYKNDSVYQSTADFTSSLASVRAQVRQGETLSNALSQQPDYFDQYFVGMVKSGEAAGELVGVLKQLQTQLESDQALTEKIKSALVYPITLVVVMALSLFIVMAYVLPRLTGLFTSFDGELSGSANFLLHLGMFFESWGITILLILGVFTLLAMVFEDSLHIRARVKDLLLRLPALRRLTAQLEFSRFSSALASLLDAGLTQVEAVGIAAEMFASSAQRQKALTAIESIREGKSFSNAMRAFPELALYYSHSIDSGEQSGQLPESLRILAERLQRDFSLRAERLTGLLEPLLVVLLGIFVGFVIFTVFSTIQSISGFAL
ncbi:MAG: type II secretion system F family protein [Arenicella sp.]|jgi:type II secretory pathway component PulF|nr:type II secretion system F family protein [Arenicella sp.]